ncbi:hypothetical protein [Paraburkholderia dinghuensis]|uniref:Uncharacterized protein n=1 Tax=Paraburkholderia dinghuensis TaxID=2305225 RepID=A0A3N6PW86_9BURK|nr:hypothetical protein [Paraburkholderia dinghuensis]RQH06600.1 hypothetical protein D1Y85_12065 [Paraburkholderia dinghuensis]
MKKLTTVDNGVLVESMPLIGRIQHCIKRAQTLQQQGDETAAMALGCAAESVLSALITGDLRNQFMVLPESVRSFYEVVQDNA